MQTMKKTILVALCGIIVCCALVIPGTADERIESAKALGAEIASITQTANDKTQYAYVANQSVYFYDVNADYDWAYHGIDYLATLNIVRGTDKYLFEPNQTITRADFVLMLYRAYDMTGYASGQYFNDVKPDAYYADAVLAAKRLGIAKGENGNFYPNRSITRQDAMVLLERTVTAAGLNLMDGDLSSYQDENQVKQYAKDAVGKLVNVGIVSGADGKLEPLSPVTRAEMGVLLYRALMVEDDENGQPHYKAHPQRINLCIGEKVYSGAIVENYDETKTYSGLVAYTDFQQDQEGYHVVVGDSAVIDQQIEYTDGVLTVNGKKELIAEDCVGVRVSPYSTLSSLMSTGGEYSAGRVSYDEDGKVNVIYYKK